MQNRFPHLFFLLALLSAGVSHGALLNKRGPEEPLKEFLNPKAWKVIGVVRIENRDGGALTYLPADGGKKKVLGKVISRANTLNKNGYTASSWAVNSTVAAIAVNAMHLKVDNDKATGKGMVFSVLPKEFALPPDNYNSYYNANSSIVTDIPAGTGLFGEGLAPCVGSAVRVLRDKPAKGFKAIGQKGEAAPLPADYTPQSGDVLEIDVRRLRRPLASMEFENRFGGIVWLNFLDGERRAVAQVLRPVQGVGRFTGTQWNRTGRVRANHTGVIDISTSGFGTIGGFQIIPDNHAMSPEMLNARLLTQWMVIGPLHALSPSLEGVAPFFAGLLAPSDAPAEPGEKDYAKKLLSRTLVQAKVEGIADWQSVPEVLERVDDGLKAVTEIRILLPIEE